MKKHIVLDFSDKIVDIREFKENIFFVDSKVRLIKVSKEFEKGKEYKLFNEPEEYKHIHLLKNGSILFKKKESLQSYSVKSKKITKYDWFSEEITAISTSNDGKFIAVGHKNGSLDIFLTNGIVYQTLSFVFGEIISLNFAKNSNKLAISCERNKTIIHDVDCNKTIGTILTKTPSTFLEFVDEERLFAISEGGFSSILNIKDEAIDSYIDNDLKGVTAISISHDGEYGIVGTYDGLIKVIFLERNKLLFSKKLSSTDITKILWIEETLIALHENGRADIFPLGELHVEVKEFISDGEYHKASDLLNDNVFLSLFSDIEKQLDKVWNESVFPRALDLILEENTEAAIYLVKPFIHDVYKNKVFNIYIDKPEIPKKLQISFDQRDFVTFFETVEQYPHLKRTHIYDLANKEWEVAYDKAFMFMKKSIKNKAVAALRDFYEVESKKHIISTLVNIPKMFLDSQRAYQERQLEEYFSYVSRAPVLKDTPEYKKIMKKAEELYKNAKTAAQENNLKDQIAFNKKLMDYKPFKKKAGDTLDSIKDKIKFLDFYKKGEIKLAYNLAERSNDIIDMPEFKELYEKYQSREALIYKYIPQGDIKEILRVLMEFTHIGFLKQKIASILKIAYIYTLEKADNKEMVDWKASFENYGRLFGLDHDLEMLSKKLDLEKEYYRASGGRNSKGYVKADFPQAILQYKTEEQIQKEVEKVQAKERGKYKFLVHIVVILAIISTVIFSTLYLQDYLSTQIKLYNDSRKTGPYRFFDYAYEEFKKQGGSEEEEKSKQQSFFDTVFGKGR